MRILRDLLVLGSWRAPLGCTDTAMDFTQPTPMSYYHRRHTKVRRPRKRSSETALKGTALGRCAYARADTARLPCAWIVASTPRTHPNRHGLSRELPCQPRSRRHRTEVRALWCRTQRWSDRHSRASPRDQFKLYRAASVSYERTIVPVGLSLNSSAREPLATSCMTDSRTPATT